MAVASPAKPRFLRRFGGGQVDPAVERDGLAWAMQHREKEAADVAFEAIEAPPVGDDGFDHRDPADSTCICFASPLADERDPNETFHDRYVGCFE